MSQSPQTEINNQKTTNEKRRKIWMVIATIIIILLFVAYGIYWFLILRFQEYTDDAYVSYYKSPLLRKQQGMLPKLISKIPT